MTVTYSIVKGGYDGVGNLDVDPMIRVSSGGLVELTSGSPCIDSADSRVAPEFDLLGNKRVDDPNHANQMLSGDDGNTTESVTDIGAVEFRGRLKRVRGQLRMSNQ